MVQEGKRPGVWAEDIPHKSGNPEKVLDLPKGNLTYQGAKTAL